MWPYIKAFFTDEDAFMRGGVILVNLVGGLLASGGVIPGTDEAIPALAGPGLVKLGHLLQTLSLAMATGRGTAPAK